MKRFYLHILNKTIECFAGNKEEASNKFDKLLLGMYSREDISNSVFTEEEHNNL